MGTFGTPTYLQLGAAVVAAAVFAYLLAWSMDRLVFRRFNSDRVAGIALSCALAFVLLMAATTFQLTRTSPFVDGPIIIPPLSFALCFVGGTAIAGAIRMRIEAAEYARGDYEEVFDGYDTSVHDWEVVEWEDRNSGRNYFRRHWVGNLSLPVSYWVNGALLSTVVLAATEFLSYRIKDGGGSLRTLALVALLYLCLSAMVSIWASVGIWRSAYWHRRRGGAPGWGVAARVLVVLSLVATVYRSEDVALQAAELGNLAVGRDSIGEMADVKVETRGTELLLEGKLAAGTAERFRKVLAASPGVRTLVLESPGGRMLEAERIAALVRERGLDTRVVTHCMSACTEILLAGHERSAPAEARIGFHQPSFPGVSAYELRDAIEETRRGYVMAGVDPYFAFRALSTPAESMWFPSHDELLAARFLTATDVISTGVRPRPDEPGAAPRPVAGR